MNKAEELPLRIDLGATAQGEAVESFVVTKIAEDGLDGGEALPVTRAANGTVDASTQVGGEMIGAGGILGFKEGDLSGGGLVRRA